MKLRFCVWSESMRTTSYNHIAFRFQFCARWWYTQWVWCAEHKNGCPRVSVDQDCNYDFRRIASSVAAAFVDCRLYPCEGPWKHAASVVLLVFYSEQVRRSALPRTWLVPLPALVNLYLPWFVSCFPNWVLSVFLWNRKWRVVSPI